MRYVELRRVVVTGLGMVTPLGCGVEPTWSRILAGKSGIKPITRIDVSAFATRFAGEVEGFDVSQYITPKEARRMDPFMHYGMGAGIQVVADSGLDFSKENGALCGATLARAHARSGDAAMIAGYIGTSGAFAKAITAFADAYAGQTAQDHERLVTAIEDGVIAARSGL